MRSVLQRLIDSARSMNKEASNDAILQIAMLFERSTFKNASPSGYVGILREDLYEVVLDESEQHHLVKELKALYEATEAYPGILWAIGKVKWHIGLQPLLEIIHNKEIQLDEDATWQALISLDNFLAFDDEPTSGNRSSILKAYNVLPLLESIQRNSEETKTRKLAKLLIEKVRHLEK